MYALLFPLLLGQCGPSGCSIPSGWPQGQPMVVDRPVGQPAVFDVEVVPQDGQVWFEGHPVRLLGGKGRVQTPPLEPGRRYRYRVTARWGDVERVWTLSFSPGQTARVVLRRDEAAPSPSGSLTGTGGSSSGGPGPASKLEGQLPVVEQDGVQNFGIDRSGLNGSAERITLGGHKITRAEATRILQAGSLADDSGKLRLTIIGTEADRRRVLDDLKGPLADIAGQCLVQDYPPDHWAVANVGFHTAGKPTIYVQAPNGKVLHRQDDYAGGAEAFRRAFERLRKPDPDYDPMRDRDRRTNDWLRLLRGDTWMHWIILAVVVCFVIWFVRRGHARACLLRIASWLPEAPPPPAQLSPELLAQLTALLRQNADAATKKGGTA